MLSARDKFILNMLISLLLKSKKYPISYSGRLLFKNRSSRRRSFPYLQKRSFTERSTLVIGIHERIRSINEVQKSIIIDTMESSNIQVSHCDANVHMVPFSKLFEVQEYVRIPYWKLHNADVMRIRSSIDIADELRVGHAINNVANTLVNKSGVVFFGEGTRVVYDTEQNVRERSFRTLDGRGGAGKLAHHDSLLSRESLFVATANISNPNIVTRPFKVRV